jgi:hypothetical protein
MTFPLATADSLSQAAALALAHAHVTYLNAHTPPPGSQRWVVSNPVEYALYWYLDYQTALDPTQMLDLANLFAYASGYLVWKQTHACSLIGWAEYPTLPQREDLYQQAQQRTAWLLAEPVSLARLRAHLRLPLPQLVELTHTLRTLAEQPAQGAYLFPFLHDQALLEAQLSPLPFIPLLSLPSLLT